MAGNSQAATYYMANNPSSGNSGWGNGSNSNAGISKALPFLTIAYATDHMSGGDTLIIDDGTYTGTTNALNSYNGNEPPIGTAGAYTIIKAEHDGEVILDGNYTNNMFYTVNAGARYWQFEGLIFHTGNDGPVTVRDASYIKFLRCGAYDTPNGNYGNWVTSGASYILFEGCYAYGSGRYKFLAYHADHIIFRNCVGRPDNIDTTGSLNPAAVFSVYTSNYVKVQNCIAIDADQDVHWITNARQGCFFVPTTSGPSTNIAFESSIGLNVKLGGLQVAQNYDTSNVSFNNIALWDCPNYAESAGYGLLLLLRADQGGAGDYAANITYGANSADGGAGDGSWATNSWPSLTNSIFYNLQPTSNFWSWGSPIFEDYDLYYANSNHTGAAGTHTSYTTNPIWSTGNTSGGLKYLPRIESGSNLDGIGQSGADIGANATTLIGTPGTLWGETGYDTDTGNSMWPFPSEDLIKEKMAAYTDATHGITGARGFATGTSKDGSSQTLTKYIWEYLGNQIPADIYGSSGDTTPPAIPSGLTVR